MAANKATGYLGTGAVFDFVTSLALLSIVIDRISKMKTSWTRWLVCFLFGLCCSGLAYSVSAADTSCGVVYVVDGAVYGPMHMASSAGWHKRVQKFDTNGKFLGKWSTANCSGLGPSDCRDGRPVHPGDRLADMGIAIDSKGYVYVQNERRNKIQKFDSNGKLITSWGIRDCSGTSQTGRACNTPDITINHKDIVLVTDAGRSQIDRYNTTGSPVEGNPLEGFAERTAGE